MSAHLPRVCFLPINTRNLSRGFDAVIEKNSAAMENMSQISALKNNLDILEANGFGFEFKGKEDGCSVAMLMSAPILIAGSSTKTNCPHGRPTLRHLADLHTILKYCMKLYICNPLGT
ncbi:hypothetical protein OESDEN_00435 [Oesophagostomum dentatum]|uniref:Uncharacterized protein n=1 Tax=Oesophagostomum dentatum TaxID=61180 RepID=A0A0B1TTY8_OESDE|nr:hypothetical protein OESDEN_00435 [Oesophagostomum dentatum]